MPAGGSLATRGRKRWRRVRPARVRGRGLRDGCESVPQLGRCSWWRARVQGEPSGTGAGRTRLLRLVVELVLLPLALVVLPSVVAAQDYGDAGTALDLKFFLRGRTGGFLSLSLSLSLHSTQHMLLQGRAARNIVGAKQKWWLLAPSLFLHHRSSPFFDVCWIKIKSIELIDSGSRDGFFALFWALRCDPTILFQSAGTVNKGVRTDAKDGEDLARKESHFILAEYLM